MINKKQIKELIIYEDQYLIAVNKPAGLLSIPDRSGNPNNAFEIFSKYCGALFIVHRIDKGTSGVLIFAKDKSTHKYLSELFENRQISKTYKTIVDGIPLSKEGSIDYKISKDPFSAFKMRISKNGKKAVSKFKLIEELGIASILEVKILTGRTHQIRIHLNAIGHPLFIDKLYGQREEFYLTEIKRKKYSIKKNTEERPLISRLTLHAFKLSFKHPKTNKTISIEAPLPKDLKALVNQLRKWAK